MEILKICLSDIPKEKIYTSEKTQKKYVDIVVETRKEKDVYGNDLGVTVGQTKEERENKASKVYVGSGKTFNFTKGESVGSDNKKDESQDLPF